MQNHWTTWKATTAAAFLWAAMAMTAAARTYVGTDGLWASDNNWSPTGIPQAGDTAVEPRGSDPIGGVGVVE